MSLTSSFFFHQVEGRNIIPLGAINRAGFISGDIVLPSDLKEGEITGELLPGFTCSFE